VFEGGKPYILL